MSHVTHINESRRTQKRDCIQKSHISGAHASCHESNRMLSRISYVICHTYRDTKHTHTRTDYRCAYSHRCCVTHIICHMSHIWTIHTGFEKEISSTAMTVGAPIICTRVCVWLYVCVCARACVCACVCVRVFGRHSETGKLKMLNAMNVCRSVCMCVQWGGGGAWMCALGWGRA